MGPASTHGHFASVMSAPATRTVNEAAVGRPKVAPMVPSKLSSRDGRVGEHDGEHGDGESDPTLQDELPPTILGRLPKVTSRRSSQFGGRSPGAIRRGSVP